MLMVFDCGNNSISFSVLYFGLYLSGILAIYNTYVFN